MSTDDADGPGVSTFFLVTFGLSWGVWTASAAGAVPLSVEVGRLVGAFGPTLAALALTATRGVAAVRRLVGRLSRWRVGARWYAFALGFPPVVSLAATGVAVFAGDPTPDFSRPTVLELYPVPPGLADAGPPALFPIVFAQTLLVGSPMGEELGWRGYALPRLQARTTALRAAVVLGVVWGVWHLPLFAAGDPLADAPPWAFLAGIVADSVLFAWLYNNTGGSVLVAVVFHAAIATTGLFVAAAPTASLVEPALKWVAVAAVVARFGATTLAGRGSKRRTSGGAFNRP